MLKFFVLFGLLNPVFFVHALVIAGGEPAPNYSKAFDVNDPRLKACILDTLRLHISASKLPELIIDDASVSISKCWYYNCVKVDFSVLKSTTQFSGSATLIVNSVEADGKPSHCELYSAEPTELDTSPAYNRFCNHPTMDSLQIRSSDNFIVVDGCARVR